MRHPVLAVSGARTRLGAQTRGEARAPLSHALLDAPPLPSRWPRPRPSRWARALFSRFSGPDIPFTDPCLQANSFLLGLKARELRVEWLGAERSSGDLGETPSQTSPGRLFRVGVYMCRCVHVGACSYVHMYTDACMQDCV